MRKPLIAATLALFALPALTPALADPPPWAPANGYRSKRGDIAYRRTDNGINY